MPVQAAIATVINAISIKLNFVFIRFSVIPFLVIKNSDRQICLWRDDHFIQNRHKLFAKIMRFGPATERGFVCLTVRSVPHIRVLDYELTGKSRPIRDVRIFLIMMLTVI